MTWWPVGDRLRAQELAMRRLAGNHPEEFSRLAQEELERIAIYQLGPVTWSAVPHSDGSGC